MKHEHHTTSTDHMSHMGHYKKLVIMTIVSFVAMYFLMYAMVDRLPNVVNNVNQIYMAGLMAAAMVIIELLVMGAMYKDKRKNIIALSASAILLIGFFMMIRNQTAVSDKQFLKSMIPHHASAILMSEEAQLTDPEIKALAVEIIKNQQAEIAQMQAKLDQLQNN